MGNRRGKTGVLSGLQVITDRPQQPPSQRRATILAVARRDRDYFMRAMYSWFSVLIVMVSPSTTKCGTWITRPVSSVAGFSVLVTAALLIPGSVRTTFKSIVLGSLTLSGVVS